MAAAAQGALERVAACGVDPRDVLRDAELAADDFSHPTHRISLSSYCQFFEVAARKTAHDGFGLEFGASFQPQQLGLLGYLAISAPTLGAGLEKFSAYLPAHQQATHVATKVAADGTAAVEYAILDPSIANRRQDAELSVAMLFNVLRHSLGPRWRPLAIHLMHSRPSGRISYEEFFGTRPRFEQTSNRIVFRRAELDCPMPRRDASLMHLLEAELTRHLPAREPGTDILERARYEIAVALPVARCDLPQIARQCGLAPWTLKRRLKQRGLTFQQLVAETRCALATQYLKRGMAVTEIALALGYSEVSAFSRAFREWTGLAPSVFVRQ